MFGRYADAIPGGMQTHVDQLALALGTNADVVNLAPARNGTPGPEQRSSHYTVFRVPIAATVASTPICPNMLGWTKQLHRRWQFDIAHLHFPDPMSHLAALALPREVRRVVTWHSDIVRQQRLLVLYRPFLASFVKHADAVVAATPAHFTSSHILSQIGDPSRFRVVPFGLDYSEFDVVPALAAQIRAKAAGKPLVFALGRHVYYKGFEYLIRAMREVNAFLVLGGTGPLTEELHRLANDHAVTDRVHFAGHIPDVELSAYYHACDIFCLPSVDPAEAFGIVQLEAMACGKPVVCCQLENGVNYVNLDRVTGLTVAPRDAAALAAAIRELAASPQLRCTLGSAARRHARSEYGIERMRSAILAVYREVLGR